MNPLDLMHVHKGTSHGYYVPWVLDRVKPTWMTPLISQYLQLAHDEAGSSQMSSQHLKLKFKFIHTSEWSLWSILMVDLRYKPNHRSYKWHQPHEKERSVFFLFIPSIFIVHMSRFYFISQESIIRFLLQLLSIQAIQALPSEITFAS